MRIIKENNWVTRGLHLIGYNCGDSFRSCHVLPHLVSVVVPAIWASYDNHPVFPPVWLLWGKRIYQRQTQTKKGDEDWLRHVLAGWRSPVWMTGIVIRINVLLLLDRREKNKNKHAMWLPGLSHDDNLFGKQASYLVAQQANKTIDFFKEENATKLQNKFQINPNGIKIKDMLYLLFDVVCEADSTERPTLTRSAGVNGTLYATL